ncbi:MAG: hypothetical protein K2Y32_00610 [Candidatus Obscuribacterales bacterium]|nr:hypothetical protein [Candidatus Obscuribacterales bacterium]
MKFVNRPWGIRINLTFLAIVFTLTLYWMYKEHNSKKALEHSPVKLKTNSSPEHAAENEP